MQRSHAESIARSPKATADLLARLSDDEVEELLYHWPHWARPNQLAPEGHWRIWLLLAGRGFGKTRTGAEWVRDQIDAGLRRIALVAPIATDARDVMVEGESGILSVCPPTNRPTYERSKARVRWPNGACAYLYSAEEPNRLRGPQFEAAWADEVSSWRYQREAWDNLMFGLRLGRDPRVVITTTPKPTLLLKEIVAREDCIVTGGSTYENRANLAEGFFTDIISKYEGSRIGRQEIYAEILEDVAGALWQRKWIDTARVIEPPDDMLRVAVAVDPPAKSTEGSDECGIVVAAKGMDGRGYVLADRSQKGTPHEWASRAVAAYHEFEADVIVAEINQGGEMVEAVIRQVDKTVSYKAVHATRGKVLRAEPIATLYEQERISHIGTLATLEDQLCAFTSDFDRKAAGYSPDRLDALVWAFTELMLKQKRKPTI